MALRSWTIGVFGSIFGIFRGIAFLLASVGLYAAIAHSVSERTQEIGVRLAMGARVTDVLRLVFAQGMGQLAIGPTIGPAAALAVTRVTGHLPVDVSPTDPLTFTSVAPALTLAGILGCAIPARRRRGRMRVRAREERLNTRLGRSRTCPTLTPALPTAGACPGGKTE